MGLTKIRFHLEVDEDGWPPAESEGLWAEPLGDGRFRVDNTPWFVRGISAEDTVKAAPGADGVLWFMETLERSGHQTIRVIPRTDGPLNGDQQLVLDAFAPLGVAGEGFSQALRIVALDIDRDADLAAVKKLCIDGEADGRWHYEEGSVTSEWLAI
ncbi:hypothetical protein GCM10025768_04940 [Microbacterium pseudoresistens]|uniref:DUF4265 domain-containing protein n=1 Tax=Microbacterium pseudoresistens TaxID=640634 RepID=A0A7Y9EUS2_9MICO|nr:DUF4265 domain-containing protein [Microbacterium pseudoresistens]NYD54330.1 hypothetical protein [Microbacterium pseudoresistens]